MKTDNSLALLAGSILLFLSACNPSHTGRNYAGAAAPVRLPDSANFSYPVNGQGVNLYTLKNRGISAAITNYGGRIVSLIVADKSGIKRDVVLGYDSLKNYRKPKEPYFGALIGRYGNRIARGKFTLGGKAFQLDLNDGVNTLHGGFTGFYSQVWTARQVSPSSLDLTLLSKDGEGGYPGNLTVKVNYTLTDSAAIRITYTATTDKETVINLTNHAYFNLSGAGSKTITDHLVKINASRYNPVDGTLIPTGIKTVTGTPFDFRKTKAIGAAINTTDIQLANGKGYDHNFILDRGSEAAEVSSPVTGIVMQVFTSEPGLQFYTGNFLTGKDHDGKVKAVYGYRSAFCMETQHFPDSPNQPAFPPTVLRPGVTYHSTTTYKFSVH